MANMITSNGSIDTPGHVLTTSGTGVYWAAANASGGGISPGIYSTLTSNQATISALTQAVIDTFPIM